MVLAARNPVHAVFFLILAFFSSAGLFVLLGAEFLAMILVVVYVGAVAVLFLFVVMMLDIPVPKLHIPKTQMLLESLSKSLGYVALFGFCFFIGTVVIGIIKVMMLLGTVFVQEGRVLSGSEVFTISKHIMQGHPAVLWFIAALLGINFFVSRHVTNNFFATTFWSISRTTIQNLPIGLIVAVILLAEMIVTLSVWVLSPDARELSLVPTPPATVLPNSHALGQVLYTDYFYAFQAVGIILLVAMIGAIVLTHRKREGVKRQNVREQLARNKANAIELREAKIGEGIR